MEFIFKLYAQLKFKMLTKNRLKRTNRCRQLSSATGRIRPVGLLLVERGASCKDLYKAFLPKFGKYGVYLVLFPSNQKLQE